MTVNDLKPGERGRILAIGGTGALRQRLLDMGFTPNTPLLVQKIAPLGDPVELFLRGYAPTLRRSEAAQITVVREEGAL